MGTTKTFTVCPGNGCHAGCIHQTHVEDGKIVKSERLIYADGEKGDICLKGQAGARLPYHPDRLQYPLKRAGKRGEGKWERITWEQALDEIAEKIDRIRKDFQPESLLMSAHINSAPLSQTQIMMIERFRNLLGATELTEGGAPDSSSFYSNFFTYGTSYATWSDPRVLTEGKTKYMIVWGHNPAETAPRFWRFIREAQRDGAKLVVIGVLHDPTAKAADWWIPVSPGSDTALALAMIGVIIKEELHDEDFIARHTNGAFLVRSDNGKLLRESDISAEAASSRYVIWDLMEGNVRAIDPYAPIPTEVKPALSGTYKPGGIDCKPAFQLLVELAGEYPPEKAESISGVPVETIERLAREYATTKPAGILIRHGLRYPNGGNGNRAIDVLGAITGNIGTMGGGTIYGCNSAGKMNAPMLKLNDEVIKNPTGALPRVLPMAQQFEAIATGKPFPIKALILHNINYIHTYPNRRRWIEKILPNLDIFVVNDIFMTETAKYADYVLPDCTVFERDDIDIGLNGHILWLGKAIEPMYECRPPIYFWSEMAKRLGYGEYFDKTVEEWIALRLDSEDPSIAGIQPPLTVERLKKEMIVRANVPEGIFYPWGPKQFPTPSGKIEFYNEELVPAGMALPVFQERLEGPRSSLAERYPLVFFTAHTRYFIHTMFANDARILEQYLKEPHLSINPADAESRGIADGDTVRVFNDRGRLKSRVLITEDVPPGVVNMPHGWWPDQFIEGHYNDLVESQSTLEIRDKAREIYWNIGYERRMAAGGGGEHTPETVLAYSPDTVFDCLCQVEKVV